MQNDKISSGIIPSTVYSRIIAALILISAGKSYLECYGRDILISNKLIDVLVKLLTGLVGTGIIESSL
jgi:hypothetical protein